MARYKNGQVPRGELVLVGSGVNGDGYWEHLLPPSTARKVNRMRALGEQRHGRTLRITPGWNGYRPLEPQRWARKAACARGRCNDAAVEGTSSHGMAWAGQITGWREADVAAIDFDNGPWVFGSVDAFYDACREVGLVPGVFDWESWHVIDLTPWAAVPSENDSKPITEEEELMSAADSIVDRVKGAITGLDTRRDTAVIETNGDYWVVDHAQGTKWNIARGQTTTADAFAYLQWLRNLGVAVYEKQAPYVLAGYRDITNMTISGEVASGIRAAAKSDAPLPITLTPTQLDQLAAALADHLADFADAEVAAPSTVDMRGALTALPFVTEAA